jgi:hypothetical protein
LSAGSLSDADIPAAVSPSEPFKEGRRRGRTLGRLERFPALLPGQGEATTVSDARTRWPEGTRPATAAKGLAERDRATGRQASPPVQGVVSRVKSRRGRGIEKTFEAASKGLDDPPWGRGPHPGEKGSHPGLMCGSSIRRRYSCGGQPERAFREGRRRGRTLESLPRHSPANGQPRTVATGSLVAGWGMARVSNPCPYVRKAGDGGKRAPPSRTLEFPCTLTTSRHDAAHTA